MEWLACEKPSLLWRALPARGGDGRDRQALLWGAAVCRRLAPILTDAASLAVLDLAEKLADGRTTADAFAESFGALRQPWDSRHSDVTPHGRATQALYNLGPYRTNVGHAASQAASVVASHAADLAVGVDSRRTWQWGTTLRTALRAEYRAQADLVREVYGNPFRQVQPDPAWQTWNGGTVVRLARAAYEKPAYPAGTLDPTCVAQLSDALEDAGCSDAAILDHLRGPGPHVRGCWAVDLLSGRP
jgi:hypothetical protein